MSELVAVVLAAGQGTRMKSSTPKVLHSVCGRPLVYFPVKAALDAGASEVVVVASPDTRDAIAQELTRHLPSDCFRLGIQVVPRGTGDAARAGVAELKGGEDVRVLLLAGDTPLLSAADLASLVGASKNQGTSLSFITFLADDATGYGRVLRDEAGHPTHIVEHKDLKSEEERQIREVNAGIYLAPLGSLRGALSGLKSDNAQREYYLTDIVPFLAKQGRVFTVVLAEQAVLGVNDRAQLSSAEGVLFARIRQRHGKAGVTIVGEPLIDDSVMIEADARIEAGVRLRGATRIGAGTLVDVGSVVDDGVIGQRCHIKPYCAITESRLGDGVKLGPFAHLRPESVLEDDCHIGNFVETKNAIIRKGAKANHLSYLGDADIGEKSNIGAGTIVCNYDGFQKRRTVVGAGVFVGSDSQLVAPITIGDGAYVATATTVTQDVPAGALAIGRVRQENKEGYGTTLRERLAAEAAAAKAKK